MSGATVFAASVVIDCRRGRTAGKHCTHCKRCSMPTHLPLPPQQQQQQQQQQHRRQRKQQQRHSTAARFAAEPEIALVVGRAPWWLPVPDAAHSKAKRRNSFAEALRDFLHNVSFHCYGKLVEKGRRFQERLFWIIFHITMLCILITFLWRTHIYDGQLLTTTMYDPLYPIRKVPFPAVSVCSLSRISNTSATRYAEELNAKDPETRGMRYFYEKIRMLSNNYLRQDNLDDYENALDFQRFLDIYDTKDSELFYNTRDRMKMLTPACSDVFVDCRLAGQEISCSKEFVETVTSRGYCCTFNGDGKYAEERSYKMSFFGSDMGLILLLNASTKDSYYKSTQLEGFVIYVYPHYNYPDVSSGDVGERFVQTGMDSFLEITPTILQTVSYVRILPPAVRKCFFEDEMPRAFGKEYSLNKCITRCRVHSIMVLCNCLLFVNPTEYLDVTTDTVWCTLRHIECLNRYDFKWANVITQRQYVQGLEREMEDALYCPYCLPLCSETRYKLSIMGLPLNSYSTPQFRNLIDANTTDLAFVRIYFNVPYAQFFRQILKDSWFEIFSFVGNICGIITGFSLIGICEVLYFFGGQLCSVLKSELKSDFQRKPKSKKQLLIYP